MKGWPIVELKQAIEALYDGPHATPKESPHGAIFLGIKNVTEDGRLDLEYIRYIAEDDMEKWTKRVIPAKDDIVFSYEATLHRYARIPEGFRGCLGRRMALVRVNKSVCDVDYLFSYFLSPLWRSEVERHILTGATVDRIPLTKVPKFKINLPPLPVQQKISGILAAYINLIENNLKQIKLLEEMAQITYEDWFMRRKINGSIIADDNIRYVEMKELISDYKNGGWGKEEPEEKFIEEGYVIRGTDIPDILSGNFNSVPKRFHTQSNLEARTLVDGDIIMEMSNGNMGSVGRSLYYCDIFNTILGSKVMCASFCKMARAKNIGYSYFVDAHIKYIHKNNQMLVYKSQGANGINNFQFEQMIEEEIINIPENKQALDDLISYFDGVYKNLAVLRKQIHFLKEAHDILLPRLMTGVIDVDSYHPGGLLKEAA